MTSELAPLLQLSDVTKLYPVPPTLGQLVGRRRSYVHAVDHVSLSLERGKVLSLVGETGSGKSTIGLMSIGLLAPTEGDVAFDGISLRGLPSKMLRRLRRRMQLIIQDPFDSLNPRQTVRQIMRVPLRAHGVDGGDARAEEILERVGLDPKRYFGRHPHELSGGQRQRVAIARALVLRPELIIADEPASSLDISVRAQILDLLVDLRSDLGLTYLIIAHDLAMVRQLSSVVAVMYAAEVVEHADVESLFNFPQHPYTRALITAVPGSRRPDLKTVPLVSSEPPSPISPPPGCRFASRCPYARDRCREEKPSLRPARSGHLVACHFAKEIASGG